MRTHSSVFFHEFVTEIEYHNMDYGTKSRKIAEFVKGLDKDHQRTVNELFKIMCGKTIGQLARQMEK